MGKSVARITKPPAVPLLYDGDQLTSEEFLRRYEADPYVVRAELLQGVVHINARRVVIDGKERVMPPISGEGHSGPQAKVIALMSVYAAQTPGLEVHGPTTVHVSTLNNPEPDALLRILPEYGGASSLGEDDYIDGPPELLVEISNTTGARDLSIRFDAYEAEGVKEYLVWRTNKNEMHWFVLRRKKYVPLVGDTNGVLKSETFPGLWLDVPQLLANDMAAALATLQQGLASPGHAAFVAKLQATARRKKK
jgi:Uma2 family endonuclease